METKIIVPIPHCRGSLIASFTGDEAYPGICISFQSDNKEYEHDIVLVEAPANTGKEGEINTYCYGDPNDDGWTDKHGMLIHDHD